MPIISAIQMTSSHALAENLAKAARLIEQAASAGSKLAVLPEMFAIFSAKGTDKVDLRESFGSGQIQSFLAGQAAKNNIWLVGGTIPVDCGRTDKIRAASLVFDNTGKVVARYDKMHLFDVTAGDKVYMESASTEPGDKIVVVDSPVGKLGLTVCYDLRFPLLLNELYKHGAEIIVSPTAFTVPTGKMHWDILTRSAAIQGFGYVVAGCQVGPHPDGRETYGHSLIVEPLGSIVECLPTGEGVISTDVDLSKVAEARAKIPVLAHQRLAVDTTVLSDSARKAVSFFDFGHS